MINFKRILSLNVFKTVKCLISSSPIVFQQVESSTIFALSSGFGKCGIAIIRVSGPNTGLVLKEIARFTRSPEPRKAFLRKLKHPITSLVLDHGLVLWFPGPHSFTGEDSCELHIHGGPAVISSVLAALNTLPNLRPALPGEFTKRAFHAGKLDLTEVEGLADLIEAETEAQRRQALVQMQGGLSDLYQSWKDILTNSVAAVEAYIDFGDVDHIEDDVLSKTRSTIEQLVESVKKHLHDGHRGERLREGVKTVIIGPPNVGKSSLFNLLNKRDAAIVSSMAGTTRDVVSTVIDIGGFPLTLNDTAGLRLGEGRDAVEAEGMSRALKEAESADLILAVLDSSTLPTTNLNQTIINHLDTLNILPLLSRCSNFPLNGHSSKSATKCLLIFNKSDLCPPLELDYPDSFACQISCHTRQGVPLLLSILESHLQDLCGRPGAESPSWSQARHRHCLDHLVTSLDHFLSTEEADIAAHHLRRGLFALATITGHVSTEQLLDRIFKSFCIGK